MCITIDVTHTTARRAGPRVTARFKNNRYVTRTYTTALTTNTEQASSIIQLHRVSIVHAVRTPATSKLVCGDWDQYSTQ